MKSAGDVVETLESILDHLRLMGDRTNELLDRDADDTLQPGTSAWELVGR